MPHDTDYDDDWLARRSFPYVIMLALIGVSATGVAIDRLIRWGWRHDPGMTIVVITSTICAAVSAIILAHLQRSGDNP